MRRHVVHHGWEFMVLIILGVIVISLSSISLQTMTINVITQSPFFLYRNTIYIASLIATLITVMLMRSRRYVLIPLITLWVLILLMPYMIYLNSLPIYNDQLGFVSEALSGVLYGHVKPIQGEPSSLGHAYLTSALTIVTGIKPIIQGAVIVQSILPFAYAIPLLALPYRDTREMTLVILITLGAILNPILYGRTPFAWVFLILFTVLLYNELNRHRGSHVLRISTIIALLVIYVAYAISDPTSLVIPIMLIVLSIFIKELRTLTLSTIALWLAIHLVIYISGSMSSLIAQLLAMIKAPTNPVPSLAIPSVNPVMKLYDYAREFTVGITYLIGLLASLLILRRGGFTANSDLPWVILFMLFVVMQATALVMSRWGMVPYSMFVISVLPILTLKTVRHSKSPQALFLTLAAILIVMSPAVKWGFSAIAFPTINDLHEASFITSHIGDTEICASGSHELLWFYFWLNNINTPINYLNPTFTPNQAATCDATAIFYRSLNTYRLDITIEYLNNEINAMNAVFNVVYKDGLWTVWSR